MIDSHCHPQLFKNSKEEITNALNNKIENIMCVATSIEDFDLLNELKNEFPNKIKISAGEHPLNDFNNFNFEKKLNILCQEKKIEAIGECGFDYKAPFDKQIKAFEIQANLAQLYNLPLIIHTREAEEITQSILNNFKTTGVFHCFTGSLNLAKFALNNNYYISFAGMCTFKKNYEQYKKLSEIIPLNKLLLETDAPYLSPEPLRGKENNIANIYYTYKFVATLYNISLEELITIIKKNYFNLFKN